MPTNDATTTVATVLSWLQRFFRGADVSSDGRPADWRDWTIAVVLGALVILEVALDPPGLVAMELIAATAALLVLPFRRQFPMQAVAIAFGAQVIADVVAAALDSDGGTTVAHDLAGFFLIYALCRWPTMRTTAVGMTLAMGFVLAGGLLDGETSWQILLILVPWLILAVFALAMRFRAALHEERDQQVRLAERNALARELHDSVAHHVSAIAVQAQAAQFVVATNPDAAITAMGAVEDIANTAIDDMRRLVGILRSDDDHARTVASMSLPTLASSTGSPQVSIVGETDLSSLPGPVAAAVYRIAQESITNARRHSRNVTVVDVDVAIHSDEVVLEVRNDGRPTTRNRGGGYGLVGMTERVESLDGTITSAPGPDGGWQVLAAIPIARTS